MLYQLVALYTCAFCWGDGGPEGGGGRGEARGDGGAHIQAHFSRELTYICRKVRCICDVKYVLVHRKVISLRSVACIDANSNLSSLSEQIAPPTQGGSATLSSGAIGGIAAGAVVGALLIIAAAAIIVIIALAVRRRKIYRKYVLPYRTFIYGEDRVTVQFSIIILII